LKFNGICSKTDQKLLPRKIFDQSELYKLAELVKQKILLETDNEKVIFLLIIFDFLALYDLNFE
jgi:hypothetical protein